MKELEGKKVYLKPTGNLARRSGGTEVVEGTVIKVARVFATLTVGNSKHEEKYKFNGRSLSNDWNGGYIVFATMQEYEDHKEHLRLANAISDKYRFSSDFANIELDKIKKVAELLGVE